MTDLELIQSYGFGVAEIPGGFALFDYQDSNDGFYITGSCSDELIQECITNHNLYDAG